MMGLEKIQWFPLATMQRLALKLVTKVKVRTMDKGLDYQGNQLPKYSPGYIKALKREMRYIRGNKEKGKSPGDKYEGYEGISLPGTIVTTKIARRQFRLRGKGVTMSAFRPRKIEKDKITLSWVAGTGDDEGGEACAPNIVDWNRKRGRDIVSGLPDDEQEYIKNYLEEDILKQFNVKVKNIKVIIG